MLFFKIFIIQTTTVNLGNGGRLVTRGSVFFCPVQTGQSDVQIHCCDYDYCNSAVHLTPSILLLVIIFIRIYW